MNSPRQSRNRSQSDDSKLESPTPVPVRTTFRHLPASPAVAERIEAEAQKLRRYFERIKHCHVVIASPHHHHRHGRHYTMRVTIGVPRGLLVISHEPARPRIVGARQVHKRAELDMSHKDIYAVIRDVFDAARRRLEDYVRLQRGDVKRPHPERLLVRERRNPASMSAKARV